MANSSSFNSSAFQDITRSVDLLCSQLSINNVTVPRINAFKNVFEFASEFESATATLTPLLQVKLLIKAFPSGRFRSWFEKEIQPLIDSGALWPEIRPKIVDRYSDIEDRDRRFNRINSLKFDPSGAVKLFDHVEGLLYSFSSGSSQVRKRPEPVLGFRYSNGLEPIKRA